MSDTARRWSPRSRRAVTASSACAESHSRAAAPERHRVAQVGHAAVGDRADVEALALQERRRDRGTRTALADGDHGAVALERPATELPDQPVGDVARAGDVARVALDRLAH